MPVLVVELPPICSGNATGGYLPAPDSRRPRAPRFRQRSLKAPVPMPCYCPQKRSRLAQLKVASPTPPSCSLAYSPTLPLTLAMPYSLVDVAFFQDAPSTMISAVTLPRSVSFCADR